MVQQMERWDKAMRDYETLKKEMPGDLDIAKTLFQVQVAHKKSKGEKVIESEHGGKVEDISSSDRLREAISQPGTLTKSFCRWSLMKVSCMETSRVVFTSISDPESASFQVFQWFNLTQNGAINADKWQPMLTNSASCILQ